MQTTKNKRWMWWMVALALLAGGGAWWWKGRAEAGGNGAVQYKTVALEPGEIVQTVTANGALGAVQTVLVGSEVSGKITELMVDFNSTVTNGQVLARLDASTYERELDQAQAELESAAASLKLAKANGRRARELLDLNLVSQADYDQTEASLSQAKASLRMREASLSKVQVDLEKTTIISPMDGVVISREVDVGQTVAASLNAPTLFTLAQDLRQMRIEAQVSEADVGGVAEGQSVSFTVDAYPTRTFSGTVSQVRFAPVTDQGVVNYIAIVEVANDDLKLRPGMTANATVVTARREKALRLPNAALRFRPPADVAVEVSEQPTRTDGPPTAEGGASRSEKGSRGEGHGGRPDEMRRAQWKNRGDLGSRGADGTDPAVRRTVYVQDDQGKLHGKSVELGISDGSWTEVLGPSLKEGDRIVTGIQTETDRTANGKMESGSPFMPVRPPRGIR